MYHQKIEIGDGAVPAAIDYDIDEDCGVLWIDSIKVGGVEIVGAFTESQLKPIEWQLWSGHDRVEAELDSLYREDRAADRAAFKEAYA